MMERNSLFVFTFAEWEVDTALVLLKPLEDAIALLYQRWANKCKVFFRCIVLEI